MDSDADAEVVLNGRILSAPLTGVQRYVGEILPHMSVRVACLRPRRMARGLAGHAWEQTVLPTRLHGRTLWSPSNTGPVAVRNQVLTIHDVVPLDHPEWLNPRFAVWYRWLLPRLVRRVRHIIAISEFTRSRLLATTRADPARITVVPHGLDARFQPPPPAAVEQARRVLDLPPGPYILSLGSLEPRKNLRSLLAAWRALAPTLTPEVWLVIAGGPGSARVFAASDVATPPRTRFLGRVPDDLLPALYGGALAFCYPSLYEGFGKPPLEAMACATPVLASCTSVFPEILGDAALLVSPEAPAIAAGLRRLIGDDQLRAQLSGQGRARAAQFTWDRAAQATGRILTAR